MLEEHSKTHMTKEEKHIVNLEFERRCGEMKHHVCEECKSVRLCNELGVSRLCKKCCSSETGHLLQQNALPVWHDPSGVAHYEVPEVLRHLTIAEKMLIQLASVVVPFKHLKHGVLGLTGHVCCFEQDVNEFVKTLPRARHSTNCLQVIKDMTTEIGSNERRQQSFRVNRSKVPQALRWLKQHNALCHDIEIDESRLDWIDGEEGSLEDNLVTCNEVITRQDEMFDKNSDLGPNRSETIEQIKGKDCLDTFGFLDEDTSSRLSDNDKLIEEGLLHAISKSTRKKDIAVAWPKTNDVAMKEHSSKKTLAMAFPWLFPGGIGDVKDFPKKHASGLKEWGEMSLRCQDGRFQKDKFFCFCALNYITRHRNANESNWFITNFNEGGPETLQELKESIANGDNRFVNRITHMNQHITGSSPYWNKKRSEIYNWVNHHVQEGNGPPQLFMTLSCAEHYWPELLALIQDRMRIAGDDFESCCLGSPKLHAILNECSLVVQEFFQLRVNAWLETVGKQVFGIQHYCAKCEFAPGRGQIHVHMLAICEDNSTYKLCHMDMKEKNGKVKRAERLSQCVKNKFGMTATVPDDFDDLSFTCHPSSIPYSASDETTDGASLLRHCQVHNCNGCCMRKGNHEKE